MRVQKEAIVKRDLLIYLKILVLVPLYDALSFNIERNVAIFLYLNR